MLMDRKLYQVSMFIKNITSNLKFLVITWTSYHVNQTENHKCSPTTRGKLQALFHLLISLGYGHYLVVIKASFFIARHQIQWLKRGRGSRGREWEKRREVNYGQDINK